MSSTIRLIPYVYYNNSHQIMFRVFSWDHLNMNKHCKTQCISPNRVFCRGSYDLGKGPSAADTFPEIGVPFAFPYYP